MALMERSEGLRVRRCAPTSPWPRSAKLTVSVSSKYFTDATSPAIKRILAARERSRRRPRNVVFPGAQAVEKSLRPLVGWFENDPISHPAGDELFPVPKPTRLREAHRLAAAVPKDLGPLRHERYIYISKYILFQGSAIWFTPR